MTASTRRELRSAATSTSTTAIGLIRALTDARPIKPTSTRCLSARRPNPGRGSPYRRGNSVQTTAATSINPAQIRDFVRTKLGRNKTDGVDASHIREYCELFKPSPWAPPSKAHRRLGELQTIRSGIIAGLTEWKNRKNSGIVDAEAQALADATISHFTSQLGAVDKAIALTIDNDCDLQSKRDLLLSISGVGETLAGVVLAELPGPDVLRSSAEVVAYAGLNPRRHQSGTCIDRATRISKIGNAVLRAALYMPALSAMRYNSAIVALVTRLKSRGRLKPKQIVVAAMRKLLVLC